MHDAHTLEAIAGVIAAIKNQHDQFEILEHERTRISGDMHDEIGSGITHIALLSELIQTQSKDEKELKKDIKVIATSAHKLVQTMSEIIWALDPHNDTLENLLAYTREQSREYYELLEIELTINFPGTVPYIKLSNAQRRNLYLVTREALNNVMKHSTATIAQLKLELGNSQLCFSVTDNGTGMEKKNNKPGSNGLRNMKKRMEDIGGTIEWISGEKGTMVRYFFPF
jgi:signal transduction histidine kinase